MNFYQVAKRFMGLKSPRLKILSLVIANIANVRHIGIFLDPVIACNIRCKMCFFADDNSRPAPQKPMSEETIEKLSNSLFKNAAKLQIGCGAEPTLYKALHTLIAAGKKAQIPYIEITTNGQLINYDLLKELVEAGLDGITLSLHGTTPNTYEFFMERAKFDNLLRLVEAISKIQTEYPHFTLRINYTFNNANICELQHLWELFKEVKINVLQIRPIQDMGSGMYTDFDMSEIIKNYDSLIKPVSDYCKDNGITFIGPSRDNLMHVDKTQNSFDSMIENITYCYVSPSSCYHDDFVLGKDTFKSYHRRNRTIKKLLKMAFSFTQKEETVRSSKKMNYKIS